MSLLKYDAINLAERDLQYGAEFLKKMKNKYRLAFISANVYYSGTKKLFAQPYIIKKRGGLKIGIFGVTDPEEFENFVKTETEFEISDPILAAQATVDYLRRECDVVIGLAHLALPGARNLARKVSGIDIIISGHDGMLISKPERIGKSVLMQPGFQGRFLGHIDFTVDSKNIISIDGKTVSLLENIPDDAEMSKLIKEYDEALLSMYPMESAKVSKKITPISERNCQGCHRKQHNQWKTTLHYIAWQTLVHKRQNHNPECQSCHTTRFGESNGFTTLPETPDLVNVQCAECHREISGNITTHINKFRRKPRSSNDSTNDASKPDFKPITEQTCLKCHTEDNSPNFNYEDFLAKVIH